MKIYSPLSSIVTLFVLVVSFGSSQAVYAQLGASDRDMAMNLLDITRDTIKKNYYDPTFHGVDIDFVFEQAKERMKAAPNRDALMLTIASAVMTLDDSHTTFLPPARAAEIEYGWKTGVIGDDVYI